MNLFKNKRIVSFFIAFTMILGLITVPTKDVHAQKAEYIVISEVYGGGGNSGAPYNRDFIELYNPTDKDIDLAGWQVQYGSATGSFGNNNHILEAGIIKAGGYYLLHEANGSNGVDLPVVADQIGKLNLSGTNGKVRLVNSNGDVIDLIGYGSAKEFEGDAAAPVLSNATSAKRKDNNGSIDNKTNGWDTDNNAEDFYTGEPTPKNSSYVNDEDEVTPPPVEGEIISISNARKAAIGSTVKVEGIVTFKEPSGSSFNYAIQDETAGIALRGAEELNIGDKVVVEGKTSEFNGLVQVAFTLIEKTGENVELPTPKEVTISEIVDNNGGENYESQRVKISAVELGAINTGGNTTIKDIIEEKSTILYKVPTLEGIQEGDFVDVVGVCSQYNSYQIRVVDASDVVKVDPVEKPTPEDKEGPKVTNLKPAANSNIKDNRRPEISATFEDETEVDMSSVKMYIDGVEVTSDLVKENNTVKYVVTQDLADGKHNVKVVIKDTLGNETTREWSFTVGDVEYTPYFGQMHSHTTLSDGAGSIDEAYSYAKDKAELDFFAVTDHSNWFTNDTQANIADGSMSETWMTGVNTAEKYNKDGEFAAFYGYEMTWSGGTGGYGHINTFNTPGFETRTNKDMTLKKYYDTLKTQEESLSQLNHPGKTFGDFTDFAHYDEEIDELVTLIEVGNGEGTIGSNGYFPSYEYYTRALDKGWHVAPTNNQDNHKGLWGNSNTARTIALASDLTKDSIYDAIRQRRIYASEDENLIIDYTLNGEVMGTILEDKPEKINIKVNIEDPDKNDVIGQVLVISNGGVVVASDEINSSKGTVEFELDPHYSYYYIKVIQADKDIAVTAPVWVGEVEKAGISKTEASTAMALKDEEITVTTELFNNENTVLEISEIQYSIDGQVIDTTTEKIVVQPLGTASYGFNYTPTKAGNFNVDVKATATIGGVNKSYTDVLKIKVADPVVTTKVLIDGTHNNDYVNGYYAGNMKNFTSIANDEGIVVKVETKSITEEMLLDTQLLVISAPAKKAGNVNGVAYQPASFSDEFIEMIKRYVENGGNLIISGIADYQDGIGEYASSTQLNKLLEAIGATSRINNDEVVDYEINSGQEYRLALSNHNMKASILNGISSEQTYSFYSGCSVAIDPIAYSEGKADWLVRGYDSTYTFDSNKNTEGVSIPKGEVIALAEETLSGGGKMYIGGTVFTSDFEVKAELDNAGSVQNSNYNIVVNILDDVKKEIPVTDIADAISGATGQVFCVEGTATSGTLEGNAFFDTIYIQDETAGVNLFPISNAVIKPGQKLRVIGAVSSYEGERQLEVSSFEVIDTTVNPVKPTIMTTADAMEHKNVGTLIEVKGTITNVVIKNNVVESIFVKDESGKEARVFINGYIGYSNSQSANLEEIAKVGNTITAIGLGSIDTEGPRLRVRDRSEIVLVSAADENEGGEDNTGTSEEEIKDMVNNANKGDVIEIVPSIESGKKEVEINKETIQVIIDKQLEIEIKDDEVEISIDSSVISQLLDKEGSFKFEVEEISQDYINELEEAGIATIGNIKLKASVNSIDGTIKVRVKVTEKSLRTLNEAYAYAMVNGTYELISKVVIDNEGYVAFETSYLGDIIITKDAINTEDGGQVPPTDEEADSNEGGQVPPTDEEDDSNNGGQTPPTDNNGDEEKPGIETNPEGDKGEEKPQEPSLPNTGGRNATGIVVFGLILTVTGGYIFIKKKDNVA